MSIITNANPFCAVEQATAGDVVEIVASAFAPIRTNGKVFSSVVNGIEGSPVLIGGTLEAPAYILHTKDISNGTLPRNVVSNSNFSAWTTTSKPAQWAVTIGTGTIVYESGALKITKGSTGSTIVEQDIFMRAGVQMRMSFSYKNNLATKYAGVLVWDRTTGKKLACDGTWGTSGCTLPDSVVGYSNFVLDFFPPVTGKYTIQLYPYSNLQPVWYKDIEIKQIDPCLWYSDSGILAIDGVASGLAPMLACSISEWDSLGCDALVTVDHASSLSVCKETENSYWYENGIIYYNCGNEDISSLHIEYGQTHLLSGVITGSGLHIKNAHNVMKNIRAFGANGVGLALTGGVAGLGGDNVVVRGSLNRGVEASVAGTVAEINDVVAVGGYDDGIDSTSGAVLTANRCLALENWDEGFEAWGAAGVIHANFCVSARNGRNGDAGSEGMVASDTATLYAKHCVSIDNAGRGLRAMGTGNLHAQNCAAYGNGVADVGCEDTASLGTCDHNIYGVADAGWIAKGGAGVGTFVGDPRINPKTYKASDNSRVCNSGVIISGVNDGGEPDIYGTATRSTPNIGVDQSAGAGYGPWSTCDASLPTDGTIFKSHAMPIAAKKLTVFPCVASQSQINEAKE